MKKNELNFFIREKQPVHVVVDPTLSKVLRPHQREVMLYDHLFRILEREKKQLTRDSNLLLKMKIFRVVFYGKLEISVKLLRHFIEYNGINCRNSK